MKDVEHESWAYVLFFHLQKTNHVDSDNSLQTQSFYNNHHHTP